jgi:hypothetical protein
MKIIYANFFEMIVAEKDRVDSLIRSGGLQFIATGMKSYPDSLDILQQSVRLLDIIATLGRPSCTLIIDLITLLLL